jgi:hypothetical protein
MQATTSGFSTDTWQDTILGIAREEMRHLLSIQNLLRAIGGPLRFEREGFPYRSQLYPFPFVLEPLTKNSLAKHVAAEMPEDVDPKILPPDKRRSFGRGQHKVPEGQSGDPAKTWPAPLVGGKKIESLGTLYTDEVGRLKVAGGYGTSGTPDPKSMPGSFPDDIRWDNNDNWFDDISDGSISARII